jgi:hypothetical protein
MPGARSGRRCPPPVAESERLLKILYAGRGISEELITTLTRHRGEEVS